MRTSLQIRPKAVHRQIACFADRNHQFAKRAAHLTAYLRMNRENPNCAANRVLVRQRGAWVLLGQIIEQAVKIP